MGNAIAYSLFPRSRTSHPGPVSCETQRAPRGCPESYATVRLRVAQFYSGQKPFVAFGKVPQADGRDLVERPFGAVVRGAEAVARIVHYGTIRSGSAGHALVSSGFSRKASWRGTKVSLDAAISSMLHQRNSQKLSRSSTVRAVGIGSKDGTR